MNLLINKIIIFITFFALLVSCANRGQGPTGGPKDETPPSVMHSFPANNSLNVTKDKIEITFDENVQVQKVAEKVIISPPQRRPPDIKAYGKTVSVQLNDTLLPNTTYSISFGDAISDLNENNPLKNYVFAFSTGHKIDTLQISGTLLKADNLNPVKGVLVGVYSDLTDSAFLKKPFLRISKTDENGNFIIPNMHEGKYKVRALQDDSRDYMYQPGEALAFNESVFSPTFEFYQRSDTTWKDSITVDTIKMVRATRFLPDDILLRFFKEDFKKQYFVKSVRTAPHFFTLYFNAPAADLPQIKPLNINWDNKYFLQKNPTKDTLTFWLNDSSLMAKDTINLQMKYLKTDSLNKLSYVTDTVSVFMKGVRPQRKGQARKTKKEALIVKTNVANPFDVYIPVLLSFNVPLKTFDSTKIYLEQKIDTVYYPLKKKITPADSIGMKYNVSFKWVPEKSYRLRIDSAAFHSIYETTNNKLSSDFTIKSLDDYSGMKLHLEKFDSTLVFQVMSAKDEVIRSVPAARNGVTVQYLQPGDYYIRAFLDRNKNGKWDTGNYLKKLQPEEVFYYPKKLTLIKNWDFEETIDFNKLPLLKQKPEELKKNEQKESGN